MSAFIKSGQLFLIMVPWNKNKSVGQKKPFTENQVERIKKIMLANDDLAGLAMFSCALDSMLRSSDITKLKVGDILDFQENVKSQITLKQQKTGAPHRIRISKETIEYVENYLATAKKSNENYLFTAGKKATPMTRKTYARRVKKWASMLGLDYREYATHSCRRSNAVKVYEKTKDLDLVRILLGQKSLDSTKHYIGGDQDKALDQYEKEFLD